MRDQADDSGAIIRIPAGRAAAGMVTSGAGDADVHMRHALVGRDWLDMSYESTVLFYRDTLEIIKDKSQQYT